MFANGYAMRRLALVFLCPFVLGYAHSAVVARARVPPTYNGTFVACNAPTRLVSIVRGKDSTTALQTMPSGIRGKALLPAMESAYDQYWAAADESAAVVATSVRSPGLIHLVTWTNRPVELVGVVLDVDFQKDQVLVATALDGDRVRVRILDSRSGNIVADSMFHDSIGTDIGYFSMRLTEDGRSYYYIKFSDAGARVVMIRDVVTGEVVATSPAGIGDVDDVSMFSKKRGILAAGGKAYLWGEGAPEMVRLEPAIGWINEIIEPGGSGIYAVRGRAGWGVIDPRTADWKLVVPGLAQNLLVDSSYLTHLSLVGETPTLSVYDFSGVHPRLVRRIGSGSAVQGDVACTNAFGMMISRDGKFSWQKALPIAIP